MSRHDDDQPTNLSNDDQLPPSRTRRAWTGVQRMNPDAALKWAALSMGGSVGLVAVLIILETIGRWAMAMVGMVWPLVSLLVGMF